MEVRNQILIASYPGFKHLPQVAQSRLVRVFAMTETKEHMGCFGSNPALGLHVTS